MPQKYGNLAKGLLIVIYLLLSACATQSESKTDGDALPTSATSNNPKAASINMQLGIGYLQQGDIDRAKQKLMFAQKQDPNSPLVWDAMAYFYAATGDVQQANVLYKKAIALAPNNGKTLNNYGVFLCDQGKYSQALMYFDKAVKDPAYVTTGQAYENAALCAEQIPDMQKAQSLFTRALQNDPTLSTSNLEMAEILFNQKKYSRSMFYLQRYKMNAKPNAESLWLEIQLANMSGDQNTVASDALLLKDQFPLSKEYQQFKKSGINL